MLAAIVSYVTVDASLGTRGTSPAAQPANGLLVCIGQDSVLRAAPAGLPCPSGQLSLPLGTVSKSHAGPPRPMKVLDLDDDSPKPPDPHLGTPTQSDQLAQLESRIRNLRRSALFVVLNKQGKRLLAVLPEGVVVYNGNETAVAAVRPTADGGFFRALSVDGKLAAAVGVSEWRAGVWLRENDASVVELGRQPAGNYGFRVTSTSPGDPPIAGIGESAGGTGVLLVSTASGQPKALMSLLDATGALSIEGARGGNIATLKQSELGPGLLALSDDSGQVCVKMAVKDNRYGAVGTGPRAGFPYVPASGLPGSYFLGCSGGPRCTGY